MTLIDKLRGALGFGPKLRNKRGGMAWVKRYGENYGAHALAGNAVKTVSLVQGKFWVIAPPLEYTVTGACRVLSPNGITARPGDRVTATAIADECLEPWRDTGLTTDEVRDLYAPAPEKVTV
jgi:hypothetical protein